MVMARRAQSVGARGRFGQPGSHPEQLDDATSVVPLGYKGMRLVVRNTFVELHTEAAWFAADIDCQKDFDSDASTSEGAPSSVADFLAEEACGPDSSDAALEKIFMEFEASKSDSRTSIVLKNLPFVCPNTMIVDLLDSFGLRAQYDFVYAPTNFKVWESYGYAFVNMADHESAKTAIKLLNGYDAWATSERLPLDVTWCESHQGLSAHVERYRSSPVMHSSVADCFKPLLFSEGRRVTFPKPTKHIKAPKCRHGNHFDRARKEDDFGGRAATPSFR